MEVTEKMGFAGFSYFVANAKVAVDQWEGGYHQKMSLTRSKD